MAQTGSGIGSSGSFWNGTASDFPTVPWAIEDFHGPDVCGTEDGNIQVSGTQQHSDRSIVCQNSD